MTIPKFKFSVDSPRNVTFRYSEEFDLDDLGFTEEEWNEINQEEKEAALDEYCKELLFNNYVEFGYEEIASDS